LRTCCRMIGCNNMDCMSKLSKGLGDRLHKTTDTIAWKSWIS
jgi:hypothetical protein